MLSGRCQDLKGITFLFRFGHAVCLTTIPFLMACCGSQHSLRHAGRMAWTSWIINMIFRAVVMETQAVPHIWIIRIRHILNITFNQRGDYPPKTKHSPQFLKLSAVIMGLFICLFWRVWKLIHASSYIIFVSLCLNRLIGFFPVYLDSV